MDFTFEEGDRIQVVAGVQYEGKVVEKTDYGFWLTENFETEEFIAYVEITEWKMSREKNRGN